MWLGAGCALGLALSIAWAVLIEPAVDNEVSDLVIPKGTAQAIAGGQPSPFIPAALSLGTSRELRVHNEDDVAHRIGTYLILPGTTTVIKPDPVGNSLTCSLHPSGSLGVQVAGTPGVGWIIALAVLSGLPFGFLFGLISLVTRRLGTGPGTPLPVA
jgi:hypothetical protein